MPDARALTLLLAGVTVEMFAVNTDLFALNLALPSIAKDFGVSSSSAQWVVSGYLLAVGSCMVGAGRLADIVGRKRVLLIGLAVFAVGSAGSGAAPSLGLLVAFRILQGLGAALAFPVGIAVLTNAYPKERQARAIGLAFGISAIGYAVGPFLGGLLTETLSWRWVLFVNVPLLAVSFLLVARSAPESRDSTSESIDWLGLGLIVAGLGVFAYGVDRAGTLGWGSTLVVGCLVAGAGLLVAFLAHERRGSDPLLDLSLFGRRAFDLIIGAGTIANCAYVGGIFAVTLFLQDDQHLSPLVAGVVFLAPAAASVVAGPLSGRMATRLRPTTIMATALSLAAVGLAGMAAAADQWLLFVPAFAVAGLGLGLGWSYASIGTQAVVPAAQAGQASGVTLTVLVSLAGIAVALCSTVINTVSDNHGLGEAIQIVLAALAILSAIGATTLWLLGRDAQRGYAAADG